MADAGLSKYDESYVDVTGIQAIERGRFRVQRGLAHPRELERIEQQLRIHLGL